MNKQVNKFIFKNNVTPPDFYHFPETDLELVFWVAISSENNVKSNCDAKKYVLIRFWKIMNI
jgi:hypothetical protein